MQNQQCIIARNTNGISINDGYEYLLDKNGEIKVFKNEDCAVSFLKNHGFTDDDMCFVHFFQLQENI